MFSFFRSQSHWLVFCLLLSYSYGFIYFSQCKIFITQQNQVIRKLTSIVQYEDGFSSLGQWPFRLKIYRRQVRNLYLIIFLNCRSRWKWLFCSDLKIYQILASLSAMMRDEMAKNSVKNFYICVYTHTHTNLCIYLYVMMIVMLDLKLFLPDNNVT